MRRRSLPAGARIASPAGLSVRSLRARPLRSVLTAGAIVLGVGMVFGVLLLVGTVHSTFDRLYDSIYGKTDIVISGERSVGSLPEATIERVRAVAGVRSASGDIASIFRTVDARGRVDRAMDAQLYVVGVDPAQPDPTTAEQVAGRSPRAGREIELGADWAAQRGIAVGDTITLSTSEGLADLRVVGLFEFRGGLDLGGYGTASMPVDEARALMDKRGVWDEIAVVVDDGARPEDVRARLKAALGDGVAVVTPQTKGDEAQQQLASLDVVLYFFSGIALFVGGFLILNSFSMTVAQRMREIGTLRALGAGRGLVARSILAEALVLGAAGSLLGLALGFGLALLLLEAMRSFGLPVSSLDITAGPAVAAVLTGLVATCAGAAWPVLRAARVPPIRALVGDSRARRRPGLRRALLGILLFVPGLVVGGLFWFGDSAGAGALAAIGGIGSTMVMFVGMVLLAPFVVLPIASALARPLRAIMPAEGRLAGDALQANPGRTAATAATLLVALSVVVVNATVAASFIGSVSDEIDRRFARDVTVQPLAYNDFAPTQGAVSSRLREQIEALPQTGAVAARRALFVPELPGGGQQGLIVGYDPADWARVDDPAFEGASQAQALRGLADGGVAPAEAYARAVGLRVGDRLRLEGPSGTRTAPVVAIARTLDGGGQVLQMSTATLAAVYGVTRDAQLAVRARSAADREDLATRITALLARDHPGFEALSTAELKAVAEDQIAQQFGFFNAIVGIAVLVGLLGIVNTLSMSVLERTREIGVLRALGASRWRVRRTMADESLLLSLAGALAGLAAGALVALVWVVGMRETTFPGLSLHVPVGTVVTIAVLGVAIGVLAAIIPSRRAARLDPLSALRYE